MPHMTYEILQLRDLRTPYAFMNYEYAKSHQLSLDDYDSVYVGQLDDSDMPLEAILEFLYLTFNINRPSDFTGHCLSVSDVVIVNKKRYLYCDDAGWKIFYPDHVARA